MFPTILKAEIALPEEGFSLDDLKTHLRGQRVPTDVKLKPVLVGNAMDPDSADEVRLVAEWTA